MTDRNQDLVICKLSHVMQLLTEATTIPETKQVIDKARALEIYFRRQQLSTDAIGLAHAIKIGAMRRLGELLKELPKNTGAKGIGTSAVPKGNRTPATLADLGIDKKTSMIAQQLADLPQAQFEQLMEGTTTITQAMRANRKNTNESACSLDAFKDQLRPLINRQIKGAPPGSNHGIADALRELADEIDEADQPERREAAAIARDELDVHDCEPGAIRIFESAAQASTHPGSPAVIASCKSTYTQWVKDLTTKKPGVTALRRKQVDARITDIEIGKLPTKRTAQTHSAVMWAIKDLARTSPLSRGGHDDAR